MPPPTPQRAAPIVVEIGSGELIDKITILEIKAERMQDPARLANVARELDALRTARTECLGESSPELMRLEAALKAVNLELWQIEDDIRHCEQAQDFGPAFIALARAVYQTNDQRAAIKRQVNDLTGARIVEEKSYAETTVAEIAAR